MSIIDQQEERLNLLEGLTKATQTTASLLNELLDAIESNDSVPQEIKDLASALQASRDVQLPIINRLQELNDALR